MNFFYRVSKITRRNFSVSLLYTTISLKARTILSQKSNPNLKMMTICRSLFLHLCPEMHTVTKMANFTKRKIFFSSNRVNVHGFDDFSSNLWQRKQLGGIDNSDDFDKFWQNSSRRNQLGGFDDFNEFSPFWLLHAFLDSLLYAVCVFLFRALIGSLWYFPMFWLVAGIISFGFTLSNWGFNKSLSLAVCRLWTLKLFKHLLSENALCTRRVALMPFIKTWH